MVYRFDHTNIPIKLGNFSDLSYLICLGAATVKHSVGLRHMAIDKSINFFEGDVGLKIDAAKRRLIQFKCAGRKAVRNGALTGEVIRIQSLEGETDHSQSVLT